MSNQKEDIKQVKDNCCTNSYTLNVPNDKVYENCCNGGRSRARVIKSGQQPHGKTYSYSYNDYMKNKKKITYDKKLPTSKPTGSNITTTGYGGGCEEVNGCAPSETRWRVNNKKFHQQGAVSSSSRLDRLKLETIRGGSKCAVGNNCNGKYVGDKQRFTGFVKNRPCFPLYRRHRIREKKNNC